MRPQGRTLGWSKLRTATGLKVTIRIGQRLPSVELGRIVGDQLKAVDLDSLIRDRRVVLVGLPGAFTPVCSGRHLPELIGHAPSLRASGIDEIVCVAPNSPWVVHEWAQRLDREGQLTFLSDGNLDLARNSGLSITERSLFLGQCSKRFTMLLLNGIIEKMAVEDTVNALTCTRPSAFL